MKRDDFDRRAPQRYSGVTRKTANTLGGPFDENRGRRSAGPQADAFEKSPFEDGRLDNWNRREGWGREINRRRLSGPRKHGGGIIENTSRFVGRGPRGYGRSDKAIYEDVCETLTLNREVDAREIDVKVQEGIVYLDGYVSSRVIKKMTESLIENISGVKDVLNQLRFSPDKDLH